MKMFLSILWVLFICAIMLALYHFFVVKKKPAAQ